MVSRWLYRSRSVDISTKEMRREERRDGRDSRGVKKRYNNNDSCFLATNKDVPVTTTTTTVTSAGEATSLAASTTPTLCNRSQSSGSVSTRPGAMVLAVSMGGGAARIHNTSSRMTPCNKMLRCSSFGSCFSFTL